MTIICQVLSFCLALCLLASCGSVDADPQVVTKSLTNAQTRLESAGYKTNYIEDTAYLAQMVQGMNDSGFVTIEGTLVGYIEATNAISGDTDAIEIYGFLNPDDAERLAAYLVEEYLAQKYQVICRNTVVCLGTRDAIAVMK